MYSWVPGEEDVNCKGPTKSSPMTTGFQNQEPERKEKTNVHKVNLKGGEWRCVPMSAGARIVTECALTDIPARHSQTCFGSKLCKDDYE
jgi:hypothetical protein